MFATTLVQQPTTNGSGHRPILGTATLPWQQAEQRPNWRERLGTGRPARKVNAEEILSTFGSLTILRHANARPKHPHGLQQDFTRHLSDLGVSQARAIVRKLRGVLDYDLILSSSDNRSLETLKEVMGYNPERVILILEQLAPSRNDQDPINVLFERLLYRALVENGETGYLQQEPEMSRHVIELGSVALNAIVDEADWQVFSLQRSQEFKRPLNVLVSSHAVIVPMIGHEIAEILEADRSGFPGVDELMSLTEGTNTGEACALCIQFSKEGITTKYLVPDMSTITAK